MSRKTQIRDLSDDFYVAFSRGTMVLDEHAVRLVRVSRLAGTRDEVFYMSEPEARALLQKLIKEYPLDALGAV